MTSPGKSLKFTNIFIVDKRLVSYRGEEVFNIPTAIRQVDQKTIIKF